MPNGHLIYPVVTPAIIENAAHVVSDLFRAVNGVTFLPVLLWTGLGITIVVGVVMMLRKNS